MDEMAKLLHLAGHWAEHNLEHEQNYLKWAGRAEAAGLAEAALALKQMAAGTREMEPLLASLKKSLGG